MTAQNVLQYWFGSPPYAVQKSLWWGGEKNDAHLRDHWGDTVKDALDGYLDDWTQQADSNLALIVLCDQMTRNIYRHSARAFAGDERARHCVETGLKNGDLDTLHPLQAVFFLMPLEHHESLRDQDRAVDLLTTLLDRTPDEYRTEIQSNIEFARKHREVIRQFGRFPHRNEALGRASSAEEVAYLSSGGHRFGQ
ncbi:MAG: DUF924 family protein [Lysobacterales bacterium]